ncbi:iron-sulfur cluster-binding domain-containing protein [uncultured Herbaspirillum sp.]|uniref:iron-sulfur cluster-binding domain-containing protein n=1 Tax=uncultured Herbaspirillum sp. TaxID=160236 RepID=UPI0026323A9A|nr:iron-sulfur cluster-binding domain-containing protein [uncultured Herbaspirillum sp.]
MAALTEVRCDQIQTCTSGIRTLTLRVLPPSSTSGPTARSPLATLRPGQHVALCYPFESEGAQQRRYTVTRKPSEDTLEIAVRRSGAGGVSDRLHDNLQTGASLGVGDVAGEITAEAIAGCERVAMIAGGIGITLPLALLRELALRRRQGEHTPDVVLLLCAPRIADIPFLHELLGLELTSAWFRLHVCITRETIQDSERFHAGRPDARRLACLGQPQALVVCGSHALAAELGGLAAHCFPGARLLVEAFTAPQAITAVGTAATDAACLPGGRLHLREQGRSLPLRRDASLLEVLEAGDVAIKSQCRSGICGACRLRIHRGEVRRAADFCLSQQDKEAGYALACCTFALEDDIEISLPS